MFPLRICSAGEHAYVTVIALFVCLCASASEWNMSKNRHFWAPFMSFFFGKCAQKWRFLLLFHHDAPSLPTLCAALGLCPFLGRWQYCCCATATPGFTPAPCWLLIASGLLFCGRRYGWIWLWKVPKIRIWLCREKSTFLRSRARGKKNLTYIGRPLLERTTIYIYIYEDS